MALSEEAQVEQLTKEFREDFAKLRAEIGKMIVGHADVVESVLVCLFAGGHTLLEGVPGLGKTLLIRTLSEALNLEFSRIQFTPDLMPADIIGTNIITEDPQTGRRHFEFQRGPLFTQMLLADEINRATPKTQSALLEAMQEHAVTSGGTRYKLEEPFFVMATQNPIEQEGTYPLPEAQQDRFMFKIFVDYPSYDEEYKIAETTTGAELPALSKVLQHGEILQLQNVVRKVPAAPSVIQYALD
ncbi:MAG: AAA family ATPase, partial [Planctomycetes bacterium]|nr:AAA family ATPase [Planctomycetota bacterium]